MSPLRGSNASGRNGILIIRGSPTVESSDVSNSSWTGVVMLGDHSAYLANSTIPHNLASGVQAGLNSSADIYLKHHLQQHERRNFCHRSNPNVAQRHLEHSWASGLRLRINGNQTEPNGATEGDYRVPAVLPNQFQVYGSQRFCPTGPETRSTTWALRTTRESRTWFRW